MTLLLHSAPKQSYIPQIMCKEIYGNCSLIWTGNVHEMEFRGPRVNKRFSWITINDDVNNFEFFDFDFIMDLLQSNVYTTILVITDCYVFAGCSSYDLGRFWIVCQEFLACIRIQTMPLFYFSSVIVFVCCIFPFCLILIFSKNAIFFI